MSETENGTSKAAKVKPKFVKAEYHTYHKCPHCDKIFRLQTLVTTLEASE